MFTVVAGKFEDDGERNYKYIEEFGSLDEAQAALATVSSYPFAEIEYPAAANEPSGKRPGCPG